ncbi:SNF2/RAD54 family protein [Babesia gibsoni]|uniref:SNF2/RAD54 family protein n=1 Tax=Babesia gibsoni TaxID=33632 RepID=A0AAD8LRE7_BABGI|nr:SNF2/RAD54 family protein [Babesia gibsoni]
MSFNCQGVKEISADIFEQAVATDVEEVFRFEVVLKRLNQRLNNLEVSDEERDKLNRFVKQIKCITNRIIAKGLGEDDDLSEEEAELNYEFIGDSKVRIGSEILVIPEDENADPPSKNVEEGFAKLQLNGQAVYQISDGIYLPCLIFDELYMHQKRGVKWLAGLHLKKSGGILADEMGLGKTITVLAFFRALMFSIEVDGFERGERLEVLIVCPTTLINQWKNEMEKWTPSFNPIIFHGALGSFNKRKSIWGSKRGKHRVLITSYETLRVHIDSIKLQPWAYVVLDEGQKIRNPDAAVTLAVKTLGTPHRLILSGSPIQNSLVEFWSLMDFVAPGRLGTLPLFVEQIAEPISKHGNASNASVAYNCVLRLRDLVGPYIFRNLKSDCAGALRLPKKTEDIILCTLTHAQYHVYVGLIKSMLNMTTVYEENLPVIIKHSRKLIRSRLNSNNMFVLLTMLRKVCNHPDLVLKEKPEDLGCLNRSSKLMVALDIIENWEKGGHKILVFFQTIQMLNILYSNLSEIYGERRIAVLDGDIAVKRRSRILESFEQDSNLFILLLTTRVGGVGLNLTCADRILIFDPDWNPMIDSQARERSYRIGQNREVVIYRLITSNTVEEKIYYRQLYKFYLSERILTDPRVVCLRPLTSSALLTLPPKPSGTNDSIAYCKQVEKQLGYIDIESVMGLNGKGKNVNRRLKNVGKEPATNNPMLQSLFSNHGIEGFINHNDMEKLSYENIANHPSSTVDKSFELLKRSRMEREAYDISVPTWTGENGLAAAPIKHIRRQNSVESRGASKPALRYIGGKALGYNAGTDMKNNASDIANIILEYFRMMPNFNAPTGEVIQHFGPLIPDDRVHSFKEMLNKLCTLKKSSEGPNYWTLKSEFTNTRLNLK